MRCQFFFFILLICAWLLPLKLWAGKSWSKVAQKDLKAIHQILVNDHPGTVDDQNLQFRRVLKTNLQKHLNQSKLVRTSSEYYFLLRSYVNGFQDGHLGISPNKTFNDHHKLAGNNRWPGFVVGYLNGAFKVIETDPELTSIEKGWEVKSCDEMSMHLYLDRYVYPFYGIKKIGSGVFRHAPAVFLDRMNPLARMPQRCMFFDGHDLRAMELKWHGIDNRDYYNTLYRKAQHRGEHSDRYSLKKIEKDHYWFSVRSFKPSKNEATSLKSYIKKLRDLRGAALIVLDLRNQNGGNSYWAQMIVSALLGEDYLLNVKNSDPSQVVDYRASKRNLRHWEHTVKAQKKKFGADSDVAQVFANVVVKLKSALKKNEPFARMGVFKDKSARQARFDHRFKGKLVVLTDPYCASACLDLMDLLKPAQRSIHVGLPTSADTQYMDIRFETLPSRLMTLFLPTKVYRQEKRKPYQGYAPDIRWKALMGDTEGIQVWIMRHYTSWFESSSTKR